MSNPRAAGPSAAVLLPRVLVAALVCLPFCLTAQPAKAADRVGSETCRACHESAYRLWKASPHAKASENLTPAQRADLRCAYCHAPERAKAAQEQSPFQQSEVGLAHVEGGVGCETCHGAGQYYTPGYVMRDSELSRAVGLLDPGQKSCLVCHSAGTPSLAPFDFAAKVKLIDHWTQERTPGHPTGSAAQAGPPDGRPDAPHDAPADAHNDAPTKVASP